MLSLSLFPHLLYMNHCFCLCYINIQIKGDVDALDRTKDEESKRFRGHGIQFDFGVLIRIKEAMVDVSSSCMELALKVGLPNFITQSKVN